MTSKVNHWSRVSVANEHKWREKDQGGKCSEELNSFFKWIYTLQKGVGGKTSGETVLLPSAIFVELSKIKIFLIH